MPPSATSLAEPGVRRSRRRRLGIDILGWANWCGSVPVLFVTMFNDTGAAPPAWFPTVFVTPALGLVVVNVYLFAPAFVILVVVAGAASALEENPRAPNRFLSALRRGRDGLRAWSALASLGTVYLFAYMALAVTVRK